MFVDQKKEGEAMAERNGKEKTVVFNRRASHDYFLEDRYECGIQLTGT